jgi:arginyl-tRNA synthetase
MPDPATPESTLDPLVLLRERFARAVTAAGAALGIDLPADTDPRIEPAKRPEFGDFQCNAAMGIAKAAGKNPRDVAAAIVAALDLSDLAERIGAKDIAGPGFINIRLKPDTMSQLLARLDSPTLGITPPERPETVVVDLCGVNLAKEMHVGHIRATVIGDAVARMFERLGERVIRQNHVGDWGLNIAMVVMKLRDEIAAGRMALASTRLADLDRLYKAVQRECAGDKWGLAAVKKFGLGPKAAAELEEQNAGAEATVARAKQTLVRLQAQEPEIVAVWRHIYDLTMGDCLTNCRRLHTKVTAEASAGESSYADELGPMVEDLVARGVAEESDGGYLYATTDVAAIRRRVQKLGAARVVYCVDIRQSLHFRQVFGASIKAGYATVTDPESRRRGEPAVLQHAAFGMILGEDGLPFKTRTGENVRLTDFIDEAIARGRRIVREKNPDAPQADVDRIGEVAGIAAIKYADLANDRARDYMFSFDRLIAFEGDTGPYLLYALVRVKGIFRQAAEAGSLPGAGALDAAPIFIREPAEKALALHLLTYPAVLRAAAEACEPHRVCGFAYTLANLYSSFYEACPVLKAADEPTRLSRLRLCALAGRVLGDALETVGIPTLERM